MSDKLEKFISSNRGKFDQQTPSTDVWSSIQTGLAQQSAAAGGASAGAAKTGLAKVATAWKLTAGIVAAVAASAVIYIAATSGGDGNGPQPNATAAVSPDSGAGNRVEVVEAASPLVDPPMPEADVRFHTFSLDAKKGGTWTAPTGSVISVPKRAFIDGEGNPIAGKVDFRYREFHDGADIIMSGIPMTYDDKGTKETFQTAGMMELRGFQDGKPVFIAEDKAVGVRIASFTDEDDHNLYFLDEEKRRWVEIGRAEMGPNTAKEKGLRAIRKEPKAPRKPVRAEPGVEVPGEIAFEVDYSEFPELRPYKKVRWQAQSEVPGSLFSSVWNEIGLEEIDGAAMEYRINLKNRREKLSFRVRPVLEGKDYEKALAKFRKQKEKYDKLVAQRDAEMDRLVAQANVLRSFQVSGFGIYNCDRYYNVPDPIAIRAKIAVPDDIYLDGVRTDVYQIAGDNRAVVTHKGLNIASFTFSFSEDNYLVVVLPGNKVGVFGAEQFRRIDKSKLRKEGEHTFVLTPSEREVRDASDLRKLLGV